MATLSESQTSIVPALPGFWVHQCDEGKVVSRQMVVAWLVVYLFRSPKFDGRTIPISTEGVCDDYEYFVENPDGSCLNCMGCSFDNVDEATKHCAEIWRLVEEDNAAEADEATA